MIATLPAVQHSCKRAYRIIIKRARTSRWHKKHANRQHRRDLNRATRLIARNPERFDAEPFSAYSLSQWDLD